MRSITRHPYFWPFLFLLPTTIGFLVFRGIPIMWTFGLSFAKWKVFDTASFAGLANYISVFTSDGAGKIFANTAYFTAIYVPGVVALALVLAAILNTALRGAGFFRGAFFMPYITTTVAVTLTWRWIFSTKFGLLNNALLALGFENPPAWLADPTWALPAVALVSIWKDAGFFMLLLLAGMQTIDGSLYEAAEIDGAGPWRKFRSITVPLLSRSIFFVLILAIVRSTQTFEITYALTGGGPNGSSTTLAFAIYTQAFVYFDMGYAAALAYTLAVALGLLTLVNFHFRKKWVHE